MIEVRLAVKLTIQGPILTADTAAAATGVDAVFLRDHPDRLCLPGTLVKGCLREAMESLYRVDAGKDAFGYCLPRQENPPADQPLFEDRYPVEFEDFISIARWPKPGESVLTSIQIDDAAGTAAKGQLRFIDAPVRPGQNAEFVGRIFFSARDEQDLDARKACVLHSLNWIGSLGANKTVGFGRVIRVEVVEDGSQDARSEILHWPELAQQLSANADLADNKKDWLPLELHFQHPFCVTKQLVNGNVFESDTLISGAVIKGALARLLQQINGLDASDDLSPQKECTLFPHLCRHFSKLRVLTALPCLPKNDGRPCVRPMSLVSVRCADRSCIYDVALLDGPHLIQEQAPAFAVDWKDEDRSAVDEAMTRFGIPEPARPYTELRLRTAIDSDKRRARDEHLFAYRCICPFTRDDQQDQELLWRGAIGLHGIKDAEERGKLVSELHVLADRHAELSIGKAKTRAVFRLKYEQGTFVPVGGPDLKGRSPWVLTLMSPALLVDPFEVEKGTPSSLREEYGKVFSQLSESKLVLRRYFATQSYLGGYLAQRHRRRLDSGRLYNPIWVSDPGSVFVLDRAESVSLEEAEEVLRRWVDMGLDLPDWAKQGYGEDFTTNPLLPTNGYGEIAVNLACHTGCMPKEIERVNGL